MASKIKAPAKFREGDPLRIGREMVFFGRNIIAQTSSGFALQHRLFVQDPWETIAEGIHRTLPAGRGREIAHSFRRQAEDYFRAATVGRELAVRPVLLYYAFLNLSKAYALTRGNTKLTSKSFHGVSALPRPPAIPGSLIKFDVPSAGRPCVFQELLNHLDGNTAVLASDLRLGHLLPQILPGHRLWCYATNKAERFVSIEYFQIRHSTSAKQVWLNIFLRQGELDGIGVSESEMLSRAMLDTDFEVATCGHGDFICLQQTLPESYSAEPGEALVQIIRKTRNRIWETVKIV